MRYSLFVEQFRMGAGSDEYDAAAPSGSVVQFVDQQKISADVALPISRPFALERMIQPFGTERRIIGDQQKHRLFQTIEIISARPRQSLPILQEGSGVVAGARQRRPLTCCGSLQGLRSANLRCRSERAARAGCHGPPPWLP